MNEMKAWKEKVNYLKENARLSFMLKEKEKVLFLGCLSYYGIAVHSLSIFLHELLKLISGVHDSCRENVLIALIRFFALQINVSCHLFQAPEKPKRPIQAKMQFINDFCAERKFTNASERAKASSDAWDALSDVEKEVM